MMSTGWKPVALTVILAVAASGIGAWAGATWVLRHDTPPSLHEIVHEGLDLEPGQLARIEAIEGRFATRRIALEQRVKAANRELATAIAASDGDSRVVQPAVDHFHDAMGDLQQATIAHIFEMRTVMTPAQADAFDKGVIAALTADGA
ncbi:MAG: Spy/CpxP family protein refolding chaperone [Brevundimonas sp.]|jgi:Spy/CpxP family protein refolding chaperone|uniref:Spy/CpxP family protein refolding chaperone n=1 Tax=Brevundimonas sp. TaxID=1871086 RepID=UPI0039E59E32